MNTALSDGATRTTRDRYDRSARLYDVQAAAIERLFFQRLRARLWRMASANVRLLEVGVGTGVNISYYPPGASITAIDLSPRMIERARRRAERLNVHAELLEMDAQHLEFPDATSDAVAATCVFCSVPDPVAGLLEAWRVLKPGGQLLLLEHLRSGNSIAGKLMDVLNPLVVRMSGANINWRTMDNLAAAGVVVIDASSHAFGIVKLIEARKPAR